MLFGISNKIKDFCETAKMYQRFVGSSHKSLDSNVLVILHIRLEFEIKFEFVAFVKLRRLPIHKSLPFGNNNNKK